METINGFLFLDKEEGITSQTADIQIKRKLGQKKVGHLGTLDPFATGLLILGLGEATKFLPLLSDRDKTYVAHLILGKTTDSLDKTGNVTEEKEIPPFDQAELESVLASFLGKQKQEVPLYSAKHINGERSYVLLRKGIEFTPPMVDIDIKAIKLLSFDRGSISFEATVSKGTYIRSLGRDIATRLGTVGYLDSLRRTEVSPFSVQDAKSVEEINRGDVKDILSLFPSIKKIEAKGELLHRVEHGNEIHSDTEDDFLFFLSEGKLLALYEKKGYHRYGCKRGVSHE